MTTGRILIDLSFFRRWRRHSTHFTGIPRVIFEATNRLAVDGDFEVAVVHFDPPTGRFVFSDESLLQPEPATVTASIPPSAMSRMKQVPRRIWHRTSGSRQVLKRVPGVQAGYRALRRSYARMRQATPVEFQATDTLLLLDSLWGIPEILPAIAAEKERVGFRVATLIYDMIPVDYPHLVTPVATDAFSHFLDYALGFSDQVFAISEASKRAVISYCERHSIPLKREVIAAPLGEGYESPHDEKPPRDMPDGDFVITVSTFEPRKNYQVLYQAVKHAQLLGLRLPRILIVGRPGWSTEELQQMIRADPTTQDALVWLDEVSDNELAWLYENALFTVFPSIAEGWGLPVSESIHFGKFCIASDQASLPEIAGDLIDYVSPYDAAGWAEAISGLAGDRALLAERTDRLVREYRPRTWDSFVDVVKSGISGLSN